MCHKCNLIKLSVDLDGLEPELQRIARLMYNGKLKPGQIDAAMTKKIAEQLMQAVVKGYGNGANADSFIKKIEQNIYVFSGFKNYQQLKETSMLLLDNDGGYKSFNQFLNDVLSISETYNEVYLQAEYNTALASAQSAATWNDYEANGIAMLTYRTAGDDRVREDHAILDGITLSIDDPFWSTYYPPNEWNCRCDTEPAPIGEKPVGRAKSELPELPPMFKNNVGKNGVIFPDTHPYFKVSKEIAKTVVDQVAEILPEVKVKPTKDIDELKKDGNWSIAMDIVQDSKVKELFPKLTLNELVTINDYTNNSYKALNSELMSGKVSKLNTIKEKLLNSALDKLKTSTEQLVYRGVNLKPEQVKVYEDALKGNTKIVKNAFLSTTSEMSVAKSFNGGKDERVLFVIEHKTGKELGGSSYYSQTFGNESEGEVLFKSKTSFKVNKIEKDGKETKIYLEED